MSHRSAAASGDIAKWGEMHSKISAMMFCMTTVLVSACGGGSGASSTTSTSTNSAPVQPTPAPVTPAPVAPAPSPSPSPSPLPPPVTNPPSTPGGIETFTSTYLNGSGCQSTYEMTGAEPSTGKHPVFIYVVGTGESPTLKSALAAVNGMASRGFVAATVAYPDRNFANCPTVSFTSQCIFDAANSNSAVSRLCARDNADCSNGVVVAGFSQGAVIATFAKNFDNRVKAAYALGAHANYFDVDVNACMISGTRALPSSNLRVVNGEADVFPGDATLEKNRTDSEIVTGFTCGSSASSCLQANGSGWYIVRNTQVSDGDADHCYMRNGGCGIDVLDAGWETGGDAWALNANLDWLASFVPH